MTDSTEQSVIIKGLGSYAPKRVLTNEELSHMVDTSDEWIKTRTGIRERHIAAPDEASSDLAEKAARAALKDARMDASDLDLIIVATITPDMLFPSTACFVQNKLGIKDIPAFDISAACSGFLYALELGKNMIRSGPYKNVLVIGAEKLSSITDWKDRTTCVLFGDGAGAAVLSASDKKGYGILGCSLGADGQDYGILHMPAGGSAKPATAETLANREHFLKMQGNAVFKIAVRAMEQCAKEIIQRHGLTTEQISLVIPHQANNRIIEAISQRLEIGMDRFWVNLDSYGNTSSATIPMALSEAHKAGKIKKDDYLLFVSFGAGLTWAATLIKWQ